MNDLTTWWDQSVKEGRERVRRTRDNFAEFCGWLYEKQCELAKMGRPKVSQSGTLLSWQQFLDEIGLSRTTAYRWLNGYDPITKKIRELEPPKKPDPPKVEAPKAHVEKTAIKPAPLMYNEFLADDEDYEELSPDLGDGFDDIEQAIDTDPNDALVDLFVYLDQILDEVQTLQGKHQVCNELIKYLRGKSAEYDRKAIGGPF